MKTVYFPTVRIGDVRYRFVADFPALISFARREPGDHVWKAIPEMDLDPRGFTHFDTSREAVEYASDFCNRNHIAYSCLEAEIQEPSQVSEPALATPVSRTMYCLVERYSPDTLGAKLHPGGSFVWPGEFESPQAAISHALELLSAHYHYVAPGTCNSAGEPLNAGLYGFSSEGKVLTFWQPGWLYIKLKESTIYPVPMGDYASDTGRLSVPKPEIKSVPRT